MAALTESTKTHAFTVCLKDDTQGIERYKAYHAAPWPEIVPWLRTCGVLDMKIYLRGRRLFMHLVTTDSFDPETGFQRIEELPAARQWNEIMYPLQTPAPEAGPDEWWAAMDLIFDMQADRSHSSEGAH